MERISYSKIVELTEKEALNFFGSLFTEQLLHDSYNGYMLKIYGTIFFTIIVYEIAVIRLEHHTPWLGFLAFLIFVWFLPFKKTKLKRITKNATKKFIKTFHPLFDRKIAICFTDEQVIYGKYVFRYENLRVYLEPSSSIILQNTNGSELYTLPIPIDCEEEYHMIAAIFHKVYDNEKYKIKHFMLF